MTDRAVEVLQAEYDRLDAAIRAGVSAADRNATSAAIVALFKRTERDIAELTEFRERIRVLVDAFRARPAEPAPVSRHHDHLGASTHIERGWSALAGGDWGAAELQLRQAIALDATSSVAQALLGWALLYQDRYDDSLELCQQVLLRDPEHGLARVAVGAVCLRKGILGEAIEHLSRAATRSSDGRATLYANFWLGVAYLERDMQGDAIEFLRRSVVQGPNLAEGWAELGRALWTSGQEQEAVAAWTAGAAVRHSPHAARCALLLETVAAGGVPPRSPFT